ncbi:DUF4231 domain-containing protein [Microbacterium sp. EYE_5]|uniref:DUF4231 domain-containing protein n=1 Tax=unclassified Microbacterium TaxID=2609290 RepID=UPI0020064D54|nr:MULTISPECIES: DUF4231 domain-containing protein [unclassified Microbacterium]MCK6080979.1 DUF4231 domain-containing protein [Microbacterium sp. EYE_382]MCK6086249.1 DUF4231 domain-containing protein [Microbacterium sp. EYE_384]MCK6124253.1 DUF4231 domain-containing protein [Microbacterium sp. EYE_80]MCK6127162.1 DUF4231 domain-containing protein [Microbacterium sp. EYE_79]MCK6141934.1 DUF4231 domain-containing protein [Microbacterium sp. EYE_39]
MRKPGDDDFPAFYRAADQASLASQRRFLWVMRIRLGGLLVAAGGGALAGLQGFLPFGAWLATIALVVAIAAEFYNLKVRPDRGWYEGRAAAESAKTLAWRYMVRGEKFETDGDVDAVFAREIKALLTNLDHVPPADQHAQITELMREARSGSFDERKALYRRERLEDQRAWYASKARFNGNRFDVWTLVTIGLEFAGLLAAVMLVSGAIAFDALGVLSALAAAFTAWAQARQYQTLANAYGVTSQELASVIDQLDGVTSEDTWAAFVGQAEEAISREHTLWRASRGIKQTR